MGVKKDNTSINERYQLRHAAGLSWLLDMEQPGVPYVKPVPVNEMGAEIWELHRKGKSVDEIVSWLCASCGISPEQASADVTEFLEMLKAHGISE
ncbi:MAG: PqqD family protein [Clostridiales bacterium]|nr:PqqD family protein [Clostridiales bacterium]